ncbi:MAG: GH92 family glycosyl hydrolase [Cyclobacteriaceae bacterium]
MNLHYRILPFLLLWCLELRGQEQQSNLEYVDPTIGTVGIILAPAPPTVHLPNSMLRVVPARKDQLDDQISHFPLTVTSHRISSVFAVMAISGKDDESVWNRKLEYAGETITPYYYSTTFEDTGDSIEFTPAAKSGYFRFHFSGNANKHFLRVGLSRDSGSVSVNGKRTISGTEFFSGMRAFFYAELDTDISSVAYRHSTRQKQLLAFFGNSPKSVSFRYGISFISIEQAKQNLLNEIPQWDFQKLKNDAYKKWDQVMSQINVKGGSNAHKRIFYSALYRCYERMVDINEYGKYYSAYDQRIHESSEPFFVDSWIYDFSIALGPLQMILNPEMEVDKIKSYIKMYEQGGWMPSFALIDGDWPAMTGNYTAVWMADAWFKGLTNFDVKKAYEGLKKNSLEATVLPWRNGPGNSSLDIFYNKHGYIPGLYPGEKETVNEVSDAWEKRQSVSVTLESSYSDWCIAQLAEPSGNLKDKTLFLKRAFNYRNVFRADKGFMWPKDSVGKWIEPFNPKSAGREYFTENNAYTFNWHVKHDLNGLFKLMGGREASIDKLDQLFREDLGQPKFRFWITQPDASGLVGQFPMGNETSFFIPYLYNYLGAPWRTQKRIRFLLDTWFTDNYFGYPGDEDGGGMASFVVLSMMGFFPVTPGIPVYNIGSPVFEEISIRLPNNKKFTIEAKNNSDSNKYIQRSLLNGNPLNRPWFKHDELMHGGTLSFIMGSKPNKAWGNKESDSPPSSMYFQPAND